MRSAITRAFIGILKGKEKGMKDSFTESPRGCVCERETHRERERLIIIFTVVE